MSEEILADEGGLQPHYKKYQRQKCFIAYSEQADWAEDLLSACQAVVSRLEFNLEADYARKHFNPNIPLREKALELIANARYGIYDLSYWPDDKGNWHLPRNVFIELGIAIALNRPALLLRHASNRELELPQCLQSISAYILEFSGETTLKKVLFERLPQWLNASPRRDWWNSYCIFGGRTCEYRETHPQTIQWEQQALCCHISDSSGDVDRPDFRGMVEEMLGRFSDVTFDYLDTLPMVNGYNFLLCSHCQSVRSCPFAIYRITSHTPAETYITIGMSLALEQQFQYKIPKVLLTESKEHIPSLLQGYEVVIARNDKDRKRQLQTFLPIVMQKVRKTVWKPKPLPFAEIIPRQDVYFENIGINQAHRNLLIVEDDIDTSEMLRVYFEAQDFQVVMASSGKEFLEYLRLYLFDLVLLNVRLPDIDGFELGMILREDVRTSNLPFIYITERRARDDRIAGLKLGAIDYITKPFDVQELRLRVRNTIRFTRQYPLVKQLQGRIKILIVQDDTEINEMLNTYLDSQGYEIQIIKHGQGVLEVCRQDIPDIIILDVDLPDVDGYEIIRLLRSSSDVSHIPIIFLTRRDNHSDKIAGLELGAEDYITIPFEVEELKLRIENLISRSYQN